MPTFTESQKRMFSIDGKFRRSQRSVAPEEWLERVGHVRGWKMRSQIASIVWWDFCMFHASGVLKSALWPFYRMWNASVNATRDQVRRALIVVGYPPELADWRTRVAKDIPWRKKCRHEQ